MTLKPLICTNCGGRIDRASMVCSMCGVAYRFDEFMRPIRILESQIKYETLSGCVRIPTYAVRGLGEQTAMELTLKQMAEQMAEKILPLIQFEHEFDPRTQEMVTYGRIRVADPHYTGVGYKEVYF